MGCADFWYRGRLHLQRESIKKEVGMKSLAIWVWIVLIGVFLIGPWVLVYVGIIVGVYLLLLWLKPEWIDRFWN